MNNKEILKNAAITLPTELYSVERLAKVLKQKSVNF